MELKVRKIFEESNGYSKVSVNVEIFKAIAGFKPTLPYTTSRSESGKGVRVFNIAGTPVYTIYEGENKSSIIMKSEDAKKHLLSLEAERSSLPALPFAFA